MFLHFQPVQPAPALAVIAALVCLAFLLVRVFRGRKDHRLLRIFGASLPVRTAVLVFTGLALIFMVLAAWNPVSMRDKPSTPLHLEVVLDVSDSMMRNEQGWPGLKRDMGRRLNSGVKRSKSISNNATAGITTFSGQAAAAVTGIPLDRLQDGWNTLDHKGFAGGNGTHLERGLREAGKRLIRGGGRGALVLISDGNQTGGDALRAAEDLGKKGIPVHVFPVKGGAPSTAIASADLPRQVQANARTWLRGSLRNNGQQSLAARLSLQQNTALESEEIGLSQEHHLAQQQWARFRWPVVFNGFGLQFLDLELSAEGETHQRRFYTWVKRKPRFLSVGGDHRWTLAFAPQDADIQEVEPEDLDGFPLERVDAVVINGVPASQFSMETLEGLSQAVLEKGLGLMLVNGFHEEAERKTVLMSYNDTPIESILPISSRPRPFNWEPQSRHVVLLIDNSGSMDGYRLDMAKRIALHVVVNLMRVEDKLDLITFAAGAKHLVKDGMMNEAGKRSAVQAIQGIVAGGGTDPSNALELIGNRRLNACGMIFISDGGFSQLDYRPDCRATVFAVDQYQVPQNSPLRQLADPFPVGANFDPGAIQIPYFQPDQRKKFFEKGRFTPLSMNQTLRRSQQLPMPDLPLRGNAITYLSADGELSAVRPKVTDPILAWRQAGLGITGVFTTGFTTPWLSRTEGREAIQAWMNRLLPFTALNRYDFQLEDQGDRIQFTLSLTAENEPPPRVQALSMSLIEANGNVSDLPVKAHPLDPAVFTGHVTTSRSATSRKVMLRIEESGPDALPRPQRMPLVIPPKGDPVARGSRSEDFTHGWDRALLRQVADNSGGLFDPPPDAALFQEQPGPSQSSFLWPYFALAALASYLAAIALQRWDP